MIQPTPPTGKPITHRYTRIAVRPDVRVMSDGGYWFHVTYRIDGNDVKRSYAVDGGFAALPPQWGFWENPPAYLVREVNRQIVAMFATNEFRFYEHDADGNRRYADLRYRDAEREQWIIEACSRD